MCSTQKSGDVNIAYQVRGGGGPFDLVFVLGFPSHVGFESSIPSFAAFLDQLSSFSRVIWFDKRGTGMSDRVPGRASKAMRALGRFDDEEVRTFVDLVRFGSSPGTLEALHRMNKEIDVLYVLPAVRVPTLILHGSEDKIVPLEVAR